MPALRDIKQSTQSRIDRIFCEMARLQDLSHLERRFIDVADQLLPADCIAWNNWSLDGSHFMAAILNAAYQERFDALAELFGAHVSRHPVIAAGKFWHSVEHVLRLSDFESNRRFRENPLYGQVYQYLDSQHQLCYAPVALSDHRVVLTVNRSGRDFNNAEMQLVQYVGLRLAEVARWIETREELESGWIKLANFVSLKLEGAKIDTLTQGDLMLVSDLMQKKSIAEIAASQRVQRNSIDKRLGSIRERLNLDNQRQLLSALAQIRSARTAHQ